MKEIKVLGSGCAKCNTLARLAETAAREMSIEYTLEKVTDLDAILSYGVMMTPALVVDGQVKISGRVPSAADIKKYLS